MDEVTENDVFFVSLNEVDPNEITASFKILRGHIRRLLEIANIYVVIRHAQGEDTDWWFFYFFRVWLGLTTTTVKPGRFQWRDNTALLQLPWLSSATWETHGVVMCLSCSFEPLTPDTILTMAHPMATSVKVRRQRQYNSPGCCLCHTRLLRLSPWTDRRSVPTEECKQQSSSAHQQWQEKGRHENIKTTKKESKEKPSTHRKLLLGIPPPKINDFETVRVSINHSDGSIA